MKTAPKTKSEFYARYYAGEFGNRPQLFRDAAELIASNYQGKLTLRDGVAGGPCYYGWPSELVRHGKFPPPFNSTCRMNEAMPDRSLLIQGNVWMGASGLQLEYSREKNIGHRLAVRHPYRIDTHGLMAYSLLRTLMLPANYDDLMELLNMEGIVEFSTYSQYVGVLPHRKTVIWEVRAY